MNSTVKENELITEFMEYHVDYDSHNSPVIQFPDGDYCYLSDDPFLEWNRIMPVVEKIVKIDSEFMLLFGNVGAGAKFGSQSNGVDHWPNSAPTAIGAVRKAVVKFLESRNQK